MSARPQKPATRQLELLCGRPIQTALRVLPVRPSVCLSVSPVRAPNSKTKKDTKTRMVKTFPTAGVTNVSISVQKVRGQSHRTSKTWHKLPQWSDTVCSRRPPEAPGGWSLSTPKTPGNWTDGRISWRHSAPTSLLVFIVIIRVHCSLWRTKMTTFLQGA